MGKNEGKKEMTVKVEYWIYSDGTFNKYWKNENGQVHREDGPAYESSSGIRQWYKNGICHREDGPTIVWGNGKHEYFLNGKQYFKEEYWKEIDKIKKEREREKNDSKSKI